MNQELIKPVVKVGNSAGVILPREWNGGIAKIKLVEKPLDLKKDIFELLIPHFDDVCGIYLVGSYARGEDTQNSDIDVLVLTNKTNKRIINGKYNIILISKISLEDSLKNDLFPIISMLKEAKTIMNKDLIEKYKKTKLTRNNLQNIIEITKSSLSVCGEFIENSKEMDENLGGAISYSLVLNYRTLYIIDCLRKDKSWSTKELKMNIKKISGNLEVYEGYLRSKNKKQSKNSLLVSEGENLYNYCNKKIEEIVKWLKGKKD